MKEWKLKKQDTKAKKELDEKEGKDKATGDKKSEKPKELDSPLMNQAEIEATMAEYEVMIRFLFALRENERTSMRAQYR